MRKGSVLRERRGRGRGWGCLATAAGAGCQLGADPLLGDRRAPVQVPALQWIKKLQVEVSPSTRGMKPTARFSRRGIVLHALFYSWVIANAHGQALQRDPESVPHPSQSLSARPGVNTYKLQ